MRVNMPFGSVGAGEFGTYFIGYARSPDVIEQMLTNMFVGDPPGHHRPDPRLLHRRHRQPVLRPDRRLPRRPADARRLAAAALLVPAREAVPARLRPVISAPQRGQVGLRLGLVGREPTRRLLDRRLRAHSHSIVAGGFDERSSATRLTAGISLMIRLEIVSSRS